MEIEIAIIKYGLCSVHLDNLLVLYPDSNFVDMIQEAANVVQLQLCKEIGGTSCVLCSIEIAKFVKKQDVGV